MTDDNIAKALGRIEAAQEVQAERLRDVAGDVKGLHKDQASLSAQVSEVQRRLGRLEPEIHTSTVTNARQSATKDQERREDASRNALIALIVSIGSLLIAAWGRLTGVWG